MIYVKNEAATEFQCENTAIAIGKFDGIHLGHQLLIQGILNEKKNGRKALVFTFGFANNNGKQFLYTEQEKILNFEEFDVDVLLEYPFTKEFAALSPENFVEQCLVKKLGVKSVYVGNDFRFGKDRCGNAELLKQLGIKYGFEVHALDKYKEYDDIVSSSRIRHELGNDFEKANKMLGKNYFVYGEVVHGKHLGNTIGFPTINQVIDEEKIVPAFGVYASVVEVDGIEYAAISNLGIKPTIAGVNQLGLETFLFDYSGDLYGKWLKTSLISFVRPEMKFESIDQLKQQIAKDVEFVKNI